MTDCCVAKGLCKTTDRDDWRPMASNRWRRWLRWRRWPRFAVVLQEGTDVTVPLMPKSWAAAIIGVMRGANEVHELVTPRNWSTIARFISQRWVDMRNLMESELTDCYARRLTVILGVNRRRMASNGAEWMASMATMASMASMGRWRRWLRWWHKSALTNKSFCVPVETKERTGVVCLTDSTLPVVFVARS